MRRNILQGGDLRRARGGRRERGRGAALAAACLGLALSLGAGSGGCDDGLAGLPPPPPPPPPETTTVTLSDVSAGTDMRWMDIAGNPYSAAFRTGYSYASAEVQVTYETRGETFVAVLDASGLKPNFAYQVKLVGDRADEESFEAIGYVGRWWLDLGGTNFTDEDYEDNRDDPSVEILSYLLFDYFVADGDGNAHKEVSLESSFHVLWSQELNGGASPGADDSLLFEHTFAPDGAAYEPPDGTETAQHLWLEHEWVNPRPPLGEARLPAGVYPAFLQLTEESFHSPDDLGGAWATVLSAPVTFEVTGP